VALVKLDPGDAADHPYRFINADGTQRVNNDGTFTHIVNITVASVLYGVQFTFTILKSTWDAGGAPPLEAEHAAWVDEICGYRHVIGFHSEPEQGPDQVIYNYGKILVGPDGAESGVEVSQRMDRLNSPSTFAMIDAAWKNFTDAGAS
jgi:hypothetical protein